MKKSIKIVLTIVGVFFLLLAVLAGVTQTQFFRDRLRAAVLSNLDTLLTADVYLGPLRGNLVTGFSIDSLALTIHGDPVVCAERIDLRYNLWELPGKTLSVNNLALVRPTIRLVKGNDGVWNISRIVRPEPPDSSPSKPLSWAIVLDRLELQDGTMIVSDSTSLKAVPPLTGAERKLHNFVARNVNLVLAAQVSKAEKRLTFERFSLDCDALDFHLKRLQGTFLVTPAESRVRNLLITTDRSNLKLTASMRGFDLLGDISLERLRHSPVELNLFADPIDLNELGTLLPPVDFLNGPAYLTLIAEGEFGNLGIPRLDLATGHTRLNLKGRISNLHAPRALTLDVKMADSKIQPHDLLVLMPPFDLPDYSALGPATLTMDFNGRPLDFKTKFLLETETGGSVKADVALAIGGPKTLRYTGEFSMSKINLARLLENDQFGSSINGTVHIEGEGVKVADLASSLNAQLGPSEFRGLPLLAPNLRVAASGKVLHGSANLSLGDMTSSLSADLDTRNPKIPRFSVGADVRSFNLAPLLRDQKFDSDLTLRLETHGTGLTWNTLDGELLLDLSSSRFKDYRITAGDVHLLLQQGDPVHKQLSLRSNVADFSLTGSFDLEYLARLLSYEATNLRGAIGEKFAVLDSTLATTIDRKQLGLSRKKLADPPSLLDAEYTLQIKDLEPISIVAGDRTFNGTGALNGSIKGNFDTLAVHGLFDVQDFYYGNVQSGLLMQNSTIAFDITSLTPDQVLRNLGVRLTVEADKMHINNIMLDTLQVELAYAQEHARYSARGTADKDMRMTVRGDATVSQDGLTTLLGKLRWAYQGLTWDADSGAVVQVSQKGLHVANLVMRRDTASVAADGGLGADGTMNFEIAAHRINLADLKHFMKSEAVNRRQAFTGAADFTLKANGTFQRPVYAATLNADDISFRGIAFGDLRGKFDYQDEQLSVTLEGGPRWTSPGTAGLNITGVMPINLSLKGVDERLSDRPMNLRIRSDGVQMSILDPLLPTFNELSGIMRCDVTVGGTLRHPDYHGNISLANCSFLFEPNNIRYTMDAAFQPEGERITVTDATVRNIPADNRAGREGVMHLAGDFLLRNFVPGDFNLTATGQLLVVKETSQLSALSLYGNLFVEIGKGGLHFTGAIEQSLLKGSVIISNSSLTFPPIQANVGDDEGLSTIPVVFVNDTAKVQRPTITPSLAHYFNGDSGIKEESLQDTSSSHSFLDGVRYDLDVETAGGNTQIRMVFNSTTNEELVANLEGKFRVTADGRQWFGDLDVNRAYYNFFKRFDAEGQIRFTGDLMNPELNITARYQGTRALGDSLDESVVVTFKITGARREPKIDISMTIAGEDYYSYAGSGRGPTSRDVQTDAIQFIVYGAFPMTSAQKATARADIGTTVGSSLATGATSLVTGALSEFLRNQTGFISSVELSYGAGGTLKESADIRLSGMAWHGYWRYGGKILDDPLNSANFSIQYSFGTIFGDPSLRNFMFQLERKVENNSIGQANDLKRVDSARLFYRFSF